MRKTYRSDALAAMHETASDLHDAGVMDQRTFAAIRRAGADARAADVGRCDPRLA
jgi:DNA-binding transcriptional regulator YiaG